MKSKRALLAILSTLSIVALTGLIACSPDPAESRIVQATPVAPQPAANPQTPPTVQTAAAEDHRAEAAKYIGYYNYYRLTPEQEKIKNDALSRMPAPCCADNTMATCCCPCNMAKAVWGLSAHLIVEKGYDADRLEKAARDWLTKIKPNGYSGQACYNGGCNRSFHDDGCGGMKEGYIL